MNKHTVIKLIQSMKFYKRPLTVFLYLEWLLLCLSLIIEFRLAGLIFKPPFLKITNTGNPTVLALTILCFGIMGLKLPNKAIFSKLAYTVLGLLLILFLNIIGGRGAGFNPTLLLVLLIRSCLIFEASGRLLIAVTIWILFIISINTSIPFPREIIATIITEEHIEDMLLSFKLISGILFSFILIFVLLLVNTLVLERQSHQKLAEVNEKLRRYSLRIEDQATLQERNRIAREIHDSLGHSLTAQSIQLENALIYLESNPHKTKGFLLEAKKIVAESLKEVRTSVNALRSDPLKGQPLDIAIAKLIKEFKTHTYIEPQYYLQINLVLPLDLNQVIYRIIQEALTNISKHSSANEVTIDVQTTADSVYLRVDDNGVGFNPNQNTTGFGLQGMRERCIAFGGNLYINSQPGGGCNIIAFFPFSRVS
ncbi:MAG: sensor histidine kinase [Calothrix sp. MO_167.B12]|nr:sensor histidine kinase [Calothrix sp. MO_167.B12]